VSLEAWTCLKRQSTGDRGTVEVGRYYLCQYGYIDIRDPKISATLIDILSICLTAMLFFGLLTYLIIACKVVGDAGVIL